MSKNGMTEEEFNKHKEKVNELKAEGESQKETPEDFEEDTEKESNVVILSKAIKGKEELTFDFDKITGNFLEMCKKKYKKIESVKKDKGLTIETLDDKYYIVVASNLLEISYGAIMAAPYKDYKKILNMVRDFLQED